MHVSAPHSEKLHPSNPSALMQLGILPEGRKQKEEKLTSVQTPRFQPKIRLVSEAKEMYII